uniref:Evolutionarily conserved signaling intermediate in Toll pathway, mitochondrial n=1 Tax=Parastrongyloides trichosuri TaxID=131310 RepID=A0A0N4ZJC7_PARTI
MFLSKLLKPKSIKLCSTILSSNVNHKETFSSPELQHYNDHFECVPREDRNKITFHAAIATFKGSRTNNRGHVEFITTALKHMKEYGLHKDLDTYKALLDIFPKGPLIPVTKMQKIFLHYPQHQNCCIKVLDEMEWNKVYPDKEVHDIVSLTFGEWNFATKKIKRMLYWMPKLRHTNKYFDLRLIENKKCDNITLAKLALEMMSRDAGTEVTYATSVDRNGNESYIASAQSPLQRRLLYNLVKNYTDKGLTLNVDGPSLVYLSDHKIQYVVLSCDDPEYNENSSFLEDNDSYYNMDDIAFGVEREVRKLKNIHQQEGKVILGLAVLEENSRDSAMSWIRHLQEENANINGANILFRIKSQTVDVIDRIEDK